MKKALIFLTILLLLLGGGMPWIVSAVQDNAMLNHSDYSEITAIQLDFSERSMADKLSLLSHSQPVDITHTQATMTQEEVFTAVEREMAQYEDAGIFQWFETTRQIATPKLGIDGNDVNHFLIYWTVTYINKKDPSRSLIG